MQTLLADRIGLTPRPARREAPRFDVALLGHCPGRRRLERLLALPRALQALEALGWRDSAQSLREGRRDSLDHLPLLFHAAAEFHDLFPDAAEAPTRYRSQLAGSRAWLAQAVDDFFANGGERMWLIVVPDDDPDPREAFMPRPDTRLAQAESLRGLEVALALPDVALVALPDLERLQVPAALPDIARLRLDNPRPLFRPCSQSLDDDHRERRHSAELPPNQPTWPLATLLERLLRPLASQRPDLQLVYALPLSAAPGRGQPGLDPAARRLLESARGQVAMSALRQVQFVYPFLRSAPAGLHSPSAALAGVLARSAHRRGAWQSVAGQAWRTDASPWPEVTHAETIALRESPGLGVVCRRDGRIGLDDERLVVPALIDGGPRAGELRRFMGYLLRELRRLGDTLVFDADPDDPRPDLLLRGFFRTLHARGALRGRLPEEGFRLTRVRAQAGVLRYDIEIAPAAPIDRLWLSFEHRDGRWQAEQGHV